MATTVTNTRDVSATGKQSVTSADKDVDQIRGELVNASGHVQELDRQFNLVSLAAAGLVTGKIDDSEVLPTVLGYFLTILGNVWPALGGSILVAIFNGGPPGTLHTCPPWLLHTKS